jgi:hypothetical protein
MRADFRHHSHSSRLLHAAVPALLASLAVYPSSIASHHSALLARSVSRPWGPGVSRTKGQNHHPRYGRHIHPKGRGRTARVGMRKGSVGHAATLKGKLLRLVVGYHENTIRTMNKNDSAVNIGSSTARVGDTHSSWSCASYARCTKNACVKARVPTVLSDAVLRNPLRCKLRMLLGRKIVRINLGPLWRVGAIANITYSASAHTTRIPANLEAILKVHTCETVDYTVVLERQTQLTVRVPVCCWSSVTHEHA